MEAEQLPLLGKLSDHRLTALLDCLVRKVKYKRGRLGIRAPEAYEPGLNK